MHIFVCVFLLLSRLLSEVHGVSNGGLLSWRVVDPGNQVTANAHASKIQLEAWISFSGTSCSLDDSAEFSWTGCKGCPTRLKDISVPERCINSDVEDDWSILHFVHITSRSSVGENVELHYSESSSSLPDRVLSADVLSDIRSDTSELNSPPAVALPPVIKVQVGCPRTIPIKAYDLDGDEVSCRMATTCGSFCSDDPNSFVTLNESSCELLYNGAGSGPETVNIALIIEDYPSSNITVGGASFSSSDRLSFVSLQFTLKIDPSVPDCTAAPVVEATVSSNNPVYVIIGESYSETLTAEVTSPADSVDKFRLTGLVGATQTSAITTPSSTVYSSSFSWVASSTYIGANMACYIAKQSSGCTSPKSNSELRIGKSRVSFVVLLEIAASATTVVGTTAIADTTAAATTSAVTTIALSTVADTTVAATTSAVTTIALSTVADTTAAATTSAVTTIAPSTVADTTAAATTQAITTEGPFNPCNVGNGGCSDTCKWIGDNSSVCECSSSCWHLAADRKTCIPQVNVVCESDNIEISVPDCASIGPMAVSGYNPLNNDSIPTQCTSGHNTTHTSFQFGLHECGTASVEYESTIEYQNYVRLPINTDSGALITRTNVWYQVSIVCSYSKFNNLTVGSYYSSGSYLYHQAIPGLGFFKFGFNFYVDSTFLAAYTIKPVQYALNSMVYFALEASGTPGLQLFTESCHAYPDLPEAENDVSMHYPLIDNGCNQDSTLTSHTSPDPMQNRFSIRAFRFLYNVPGVENSTNIIIRCFVIVCLLDDSASTQCSRGCVTSSSRRKRFIANTDSKRIRRQAAETSNEKVFESPAQKVTSLNFHVYSTGETAALSEWKMPVLVVCTVIVVAALSALFCCLCCIVGPICRRRRKSKKEKDEKDSKKNSEYEEYDSDRFWPIGNSPLF